MENAIIAQNQKAEARKSGNLSLFLAPDAAGQAGDHYGRFRVCRGFIDDLNRILPIRLRIQLEGDIQKGGLTGAFRAGEVRYRWEFQAQ